MYAVVDIETTGGGIRWSRITEIAVYIHDGSRLVDSFSSLINPGMPIPAFISQLTGITDEMVQDAPPFEAIAPTLERLTRGCIFVAHNVAFDYNFIRHEFSRLGETFERDRLCTVRLSRHFIPGLGSYSLGRLCEEINIPLQDRHRAGGDAHATLLLLERLLQTAEPDKLHAFVASGSPYEALNRRLKSVRLEDIPQTAGLLYLLDDAGQQLLIDGTTNLRRRAIAFLKNKAGRLGNALQQQLADIHFEETGSGLLAVLLANEKIGAQKPPFNKAPSAPAARWRIAATEGVDGFLYLSVVRSQPGEPGPYASKRLATEKLSQLVKQFFLCRRYSSARKEACPPAGCLKACQGQEEVLTYNQRALAALGSVAKPVVPELILDRGRHQAERVVILDQGQGIVRWGLIESGGRYASEEELMAATSQNFRMAGAAPLLHHYLQKNGVLKRIPLVQEQESRYVEPS
jgi:DNA polymerase III subunit epsilon